MVKERYQEIQKAIWDIKWKHSWMVKTIVYRKGTEKEPLRNLNKKINLPLFALESLFFWCQLNISLKPLPSSCIVQKGNRDVYLSAENHRPVSAQDRLCPLYNCCDGKYISYHGISQVEEPRQQCANPIWIWGTQGDNGKVFTAKVEMAWKCMSYSVLYEHRNIHFFSCSFPRMVGKITMFPEWVSGKKIICSKKWACNAKLKRQA